MTRFSLLRHIRNPDQPLASRMRSAYMPLVLMVLAVAVLLRLVDPPLLAQLRLMVFDTYQRISPREPNPDKPVLIVDIDEASLKRIGQWPWPRTVLAKLFARLREADVAAVGTDLVFAEPDRLSPEQVLRYWPGASGLEALQNYIRKLPAHDALLASEIGKGRVVLGFILNHEKNAGAVKMKASFAFAGDDPRRYVPSYSGITRNLPVLVTGARGLGFLNWVPDRDQIVRRVPLLARLNDMLVPSMALETLRVAQGVSTYVVKSSGASGEQSFGVKSGVTSLRVGAGIVETNGAGEFNMHFSYRDPERYIPAWKVLDNRFEPGLFQGRLVLLGTSAAGLYDLRTTPLEAAVPGVEIHAQLIEQIIDGRYLHRPDFATGAELFLIVVVSLWLIVILPRAGAVWSAVAGMLAVVLVVAGSMAGFVRWGWLVDPVYPALGALAVYLTGSLIFFVDSESRRRQIRQAFGRYLAPELVRQLADHPEKLVLGGETRDITVLFADIQGFTTLSEGFDARQLIAFMNRVLTPLSNAILEHKGTIDKYMGDAIMAFWNAPLEDADHPRHAALAALDMRDRLAGLNKEMRADHDERRGAYQPVRIGVGLNSGDCSVGNMGTEQRFDYSAMGDVVNIASRLEGQTRIYGGDIIIGESTAGRIRDFALLELDRIRVKGKNEPVTMFVLLGGPEMAATERFRAWAQAQTRMLSAYRGMDWSGALALIEECRGLSEGAMTRYYDVMSARIHAYRDNPPPGRWDGVYVATSK